MKIHPGIMVLLLIFAQAPGQAQIDTFRLYYLGGQSNMDGYGYVSELPDSLDKAFEKVWIFHGNPAADGDPRGGVGLWEKLKPGHGGYEFSCNESRSILSDRFGIELSFAAKLTELYPDEKIALIKYSRGGSSLDTLIEYGGTWHPDFHGGNGINQYDHFLTTVTGAFRKRDINGDGVEDQLIPAGVIWMQGESDAQNMESARRYAANLKHLMDLIRAAFREDDLPVVIGKISDSGEDIDGKVWDYLEVVQIAQEQFTLTDGNASIVRTTESYTYSDNAHYDSKSLIDLGEEFAIKIFGLNSQNSDNQ